MLKKNMLIDQKMIDYAKFEIEIMQRMQHPYILPIDFVLQQPNFIFLVLPFSVGGDLTNLVKRMKNPKKKLKEKAATFEEK
jgi:serine/threonine protein kinase